MVRKICSLSVAIGFSSLLLAIGILTAAGQEFVIEPPVIINPGPPPGAADWPGAFAVPGKIVAPRRSVSPIYLDDMVPSGQLTPTPVTDPFGPQPYGGQWNDGGASCGPDCSSCAPDGGGSTGCRACPCGPRHTLWVRGEYLLWWDRGMRIPHLITTSTGGTAAVDAGVLGQPGTRTLYGNTKILEDARSGGRLTLGGWLDCCQHFGLEADLWWLENDSDRFSVSSDGLGSPILARPFFNINPRDPATGIFDPPAREDSQLVAYPGIIDGRVFAVSSTSLLGGGFRFLYNLCCCGSPRCDDCGCSGYGPQSRVDFLIGYRYLRLKDRLRVTEQLTSLDLAVPGSFNISDSFDSRNSFHGIDLGMQWQANWNRWSLEMLGKVAFGNTHQIVDINGRTITTVAGIDFPERGGLLALDSNRGRHEGDEFSVVPEVGLTVGYYLTRNLRASCGYSLLYWSQVARAGDQVDLDVNTDLLPPPVDPVTGALRPQFVFNDTQYWAQGLNFGLDWKW